MATARKQDTKEVILKTKGQKLEWLAQQWCGFYRKPRELDSDLRERMLDKLGIPYEEANEDEKFVRRIESAGIR